MMCLATIRPKVYTTAIIAKIASAIALMCSVTLIVTSWLLSNQPIFLLTTNTLTGFFNWALGKLSADTPTVEALTSLHSLAFLVSCLTKLLPILKLLLLAGSP